MPATEQMIDAQLVRERKESPPELHAAPSYCTCEEANPTDPLPQDAMPCSDGDAVDDTSPYGW